MHSVSHTCTCQPSESYQPFLTLSFQAHEQTFFPQIFLTIDCFGAGTPPDWLQDFWPRFNRFFLDQELILYRYSSCCYCCWATVFRKVRRFKSDRDEIWRDCSSNKYRIDWQSRTSDTNSQFQDGYHDIISRKKVLPPGAATAAASSWSIVHSCC